LESRQRRERIAPDVSRGEAGSASSESLGDDRAFFGGCATTMIGMAQVETTIRYIENQEHPHRIPAGAAWVGGETRPHVVARRFGGRIKENTLPSRRPERTKRGLPGRGGRRDSLVSSPFPRLTSGAILWRRALGATLANHAQPPMSPCIFSRYHPSPLSIKWAHLDFHQIRSSGAIFGTAPTGAQDRYRLGLWLTSCNVAPVLLALGLLWLTADG